MLSVHPKMAPIDDFDYVNPISDFQILFVLERFFSGLLSIFLLWAALLLCLCNSWAAHRTIVKLVDAAEAARTPSVRRNAQEKKECTELVNLPVDVTRQVKLSIDDVKTMMEALDRDLNENENSNLGLSAEIEGVFDDEEVRLDEVEEAFDLFDENGDGFIDAEELKKVLCGLGFRAASEVDQCRRMISAYDDDGDGRLNFQDFANLVRQSFVCV